MLALGVILLVVGVVLLLVEAHATTGGVLGAGAVVAAVGGLAIVLIAAGTGVAVGLGVAVVLGVGGLAVVAIGARRMLLSQGRRPRTGPQALVGHRGVVRSRNGHVGVFVDGALWRARPELIQEADAIHDGDHVIVEGVDGLTLSVRKAENWELSP
ncbi:MAG TPA: NfeD family protein [Solirubrobacteraceae bacterium]|nr:NfeD family protein [Solirubrobacteraceae bacterium]